MFYDTVIFDAAGTLLGRETPDYFEEFFVIAAREVGHTITLEQVKAALSDHDNFPRSICRHPNDDPLHGFMTSVFSIIIDVDQKQMHVSRGNPCSRPYETYRLVD